MGVGWSLDPYAPGPATRLIRSFLEERIDVIDFLMYADTIAPEQWVYDVELDERKRAAGQASLAKNDYELETAWRTRAWWHGFCFVCFGAAPTAIAVIVAWGS